MSWDLGFLVPEGRAPLKSEEFAAYFKGRPNYASPGEYVNEVTGVYATFSYDGPPEEVDDEGGPPVRDGLASAHVSFNLNYFRPHAFGLELAPELEAFVTHFRLQVDDPQTEGMGRGPFTVEGFLRSWDHGNRFGYTALADKAEGAATMPTSEIERHWRWNLGVPALQQSHGESLFVARTMFIRGPEGAESLAVWGDGIPTLLPRVDWVAVPREELAPRGLFGLGAPRPDMARVRLREIEPLAVLKTSPLPHLALSVPERSRRVETFIRSLKPATATLEGLAFGHVLNREYFAARDS